VPAELQLVLRSLELAVGFALVLWGLRIFKLYVAALGMVVGAAAGAGVTAVTSGSTDAMTAGMLLGALAGALLAWPLQKLVVFLASAAAGALLATLAANAWVGSDANVVALIGGGVVGGIAAIALYDTIVVAAMAFNGAQAIFHAVFVPVDAYREAPRGFVERVLSVYAEQWLAFVVTTVVFVGYAVWYQRGVRRAAKISDAGRVGARAVRRVSVRLAALILAAWGLSSWMVVNGDWELSSYALAGMHALSWPLVCLATLAFVRRYAPQTAFAGDVARPRLRRTRRFVGTALFGLIVPPAVTAALFVATGASWDVLFSYWGGFIDGSPDSVAAKWTFALLYPMLVAGAYPAALRAPAAPSSTPTEPEPATPPAPPQQPATVAA
jgi:hypothetical protein